jgi:hypothetical protein
MAHAGAPFVTDHWWIYVSKVLRQCDVSSVPRMWHDTRGYLIPNSLDCPYRLKLELFCEAVGGATTISLRVRPQTRRKRPANYHDRGGAG